jgi:hypothetical protein
MIGTFCLPLFTFVLLPIVSGTEFHIRHCCFVSENPNLTTSHYFFQNIMVLVQYLNKIIAMHTALPDRFSSIIVTSTHVQNLVIINITSPILPLNSFLSSGKSTDYVYFSHLYHISGYIYYHVQCLPFHIQTS